MEIEYFVRDLAAREPVRIPVEEQKYSELVTSSKVVHGALEIEHKYALLVDNYKELEVDLLRYAIEHATHQRSKWEHFADERLVLDRRILNYLAATRAYTLQATSTLKHVYGRDSNAYNAFVELTKQKRETDTAFKLAEFIRDFVQHHRLPVDVEGVTYSVIRWKPPRQSACTIRPKIKKKELLANRDAAKKGINTLLAGMPEEIDLKPHIRAFMRSIAELHIQVRNATDDVVKTSEQHLREAIDICKSKGCSNILSAMVISVDDPREILGYIALMEEPLNYLSELREYNSPAGRVGECFVTSQDEDLMLKDLP